MLGNTKEFEMKEEDITINILIDKINKAKEDGKPRRVYYWTRTLEKFTSLDSDKKELRRKASKVAAELFSVDVGLLFGNCRNREVVWARAFVLNYMASNGVYGIYDLCAVFGKDHSTNCNTKATHDGLIETDTIYQMYYKEFLSRMEGNPPTNMEYRIDGSYIHLTGEELEEKVFRAWMRMGCPVQEDVADELGISRQTVSTHLHNRVGLVTNKVKEQYRELKREQERVREVGQASA